MRFLLQALNQYLVSCMVCLFVYGTRCCVDKYLTFYLSKIVEHPTNSGVRDLFATSYFRYGFYAEGARFLYKSLFFS